MLLRQAKILSKEQAKLLLIYAGSTRHPPRDRLIVLLSVKAGLRAAEIAGLSWDMVPGDRDSAHRWMNRGAQTTGGDGEGAQFRSDAGSCFARGDRSGCVKNGRRSVAFPYNDPVIFLEYAVDVAQACRERGSRRSR